MHHNGRRSTLAGVLAEGHISFLAAATIIGFYSSLRRVELPGDSHTPQAEGVIGRFVGTPQRWY